MSVARRIGIVEDPRYRSHREPPGHPEGAERLGAVGEAIDGLRDALHPIEARPAEPHEVLAIHEEAHLRRLEEAAARAPAQLDADTYVSESSYEVALLAAGGAIELTRAVVRGEIDAGFAAVRPPGHHAERDRAMGFCLLNNVAIAARAARSEGLERILVLDWDVHHGNGTQHVFETDPNLLYVSIHQFPYYPGTGDFGEVGRGPGVGSTLNIPLPAGCGDAEYQGVLQRLVRPAARSFRPELLLVSAGFDAHRDDPLAAMAVSETGYRAIARLTRQLADEHCHGRAALVLEGGYSLRGLREGVGATLASLAEQPLLLPEPTPIPRGSVLEHVVERTRTVHGARIPGLGDA